MTIAFRREDGKIALKKIQLFPTEKVGCIKEFKNETQQMRGNAFMHAVYPARNGRKKAAH
jgi:hypothetical protein